MCRDGHHRGDDARVGIGGNDVADAHRAQPVLGSAVPPTHHPDSNYVDGQQPIDRIGIPAPQIRIDKRDPALSGGRDGQQFDDVDAPADDSYLVASGSECRHERGFPVGAAGRRDYGDGHGAVDVQPSSVGRSAVS